jgi:hypothetical protein
MGKGQVLQGCYGSEGGYGEGGAGGRQGEAHPIIQHSKVLQKSDEGWLECDSCEAWRFAPQYEKAVSFTCDMIKRACAHKPDFRWIEEHVAFVIADVDNLAPEVALLHPICETSLRRLLFNLQVRARALWVCQCQTCKSAPVSRGSNCKHTCIRELLNKIIQCQRDKELNQLFERVKVIRAILESICCNVNPEWWKDQSAPGQIMDQVEKAATTLDLYCAGAEIEEALNFDQDTDSEAPDDSSDSDFNPSTPRRSTNRGRRRSFTSRRSATSRQCARVRRVRAAGGGACSHRRDDSAPPAWADGSEVPAEALATGGDVPVTDDPAEAAAPPADGDARPLPPPPPSPPPAQAPHFGRLEPLNYTSQERTGVDHSRLGSAYSAVAAASRPCVSAQGAASAGQKRERQSAPDEQIETHKKVAEEHFELIDWPDASDLKRRAPQSSQGGGSAQRTRARRALPSDAHDPSREAAGDERREENGKSKGRKERVVHVRAAASMEVAGDRACTLSAGAGGAAKDGAGEGKEPEDDGNIDMELTASTAQMQGPFPSESERASGSAQPGGVDLKSAGGTGVSTQRDGENRHADEIPSTNTAGVAQGGEERSDILRMGEGGGGNALQASSKVTFTTRVSELEMKVLGDTKESPTKTVALIQRLTELEAEFDMQENAKLSIPTRIAALEEVL